MNVGDPDPDEQQPADGRAPRRRGGDPELPGRHRRPGDPPAARGLRTGQARRAPWSAWATTTLAARPRKQELFTVPNASAQKLAPTTNGVLTFDPGLTAFGFYSVWPFFGDREVFSENALNTWEPTVANRHKVRVYPMRDPNGVLVPNTYVIATEEHTSGYDYQDVVYIARNLRPASSSVGEITPSAPELVFSGVKGTTSAPQTLDDQQHRQRPAGDHRDRSHGYERAGLHPAPDQA